MENTNAITLGGKSYPLAYPMGVIALYQQTSAAIERARPPELPADPVCFCGAVKSQHTGVSLIRLGEEQKLECTGFAWDDPRLGDNLLRLSTLNKAVPGRDPERFLALVWAGLHTYSAELKKFVAPFPLEEMGNLVQFADPAALYEAVVTTIASSMPKPKPLPNAEAPAAEPGAKESQSESATSAAPLLEVECYSDSPPKKR